MGTSIRESLVSSWVDTRRAFGTTVALAYALAALTVAAVLSLGDVHVPGLPPGFVPASWLVLPAVVLAFVLTAWLEDGGYERLGADPRGGWRSFWLGTFYLPIGLMPTLVAADLMADLAPPATLVPLVPLAIWLGFFRGELIDRNADRYPLFVGTWLTILLVGAFVSPPPPDLEPVVLGSVLLASQVVAAWFAWLGGWSLLRSLLGR